MPHISGHWYTDFDNVIRQIYGSDSIPVGIMFNDDEFVITDTSDKTKALELELSGLSTATLRTWTVQDVSGTIPLLEAAQSWSGTNTFSDLSASSVNLTDNVGVQFVNHTSSGSGRVWGYLIDDDTSESLQLDLSAAISAGATLTFPATGGTVVTTSASQTLTNKTFGASTVFNNDFTLGSGVDLILNTGTGTKLGTGTSQKLSFWNKTPIIQPTTGITGATLTGGGGTTLTDTDTFDGYTVAQVVAALRNTGILA